MDRAERWSGRRCSSVCTPNNPDGRRMAEAEIGQAANTIIDESFCDTCPEASRVGAATPGRRRPQELRQILGPRGPAPRRDDRGAEMCRRMARRWDRGRCPAPRLRSARARWKIAPGPRRRAKGWRGRGAARRDDGGKWRGAWSAARPCSGPTPLPTRRALQARLARSRIWVRVFPYSRTWVRFGLPGGEDDWRRLWDALR
jgi:cobalamin biosynthetic protein CobC